MSFHPNEKQEWDYRQHYYHCPYYGPMSYMPPPNYLYPPYYLPSLAPHFEQPLERGDTKKQVIKPSQESPSNFSELEKVKESQTKEKNKKQGEKSCFKKTPRPKKNVQSNISNQVFSFLLTEKKSRQAVAKIVGGDEKKIRTFYFYMECLIKYKRKYLNRKYLGDLCILTEQSSEYNDIKLKYPKAEKLSLDEFRFILSSLVFHYLRSRCNLNILTSSKMCSVLRLEHMERRRDILNYLEEYVRPDRRFY